MDVGVHIELVAYLLTDWQQFSDGMGRYEVRRGTVAELEERLKQSRPPWWVPPPDLGMQLKSYLPQPNPWSALSPIGELLALSRAVIQPSGAGWNFSLNADQRLHLRSRLPIPLIIAGYYAASAPPAGPRAYPMLPNAVTTDASLRDLLAQGVADGHVHIGGALPFAGLFLLAAGGIERLDSELELSWFPSSGPEYRIDVMLLTVKLAAYLLWQHKHGNQEGAGLVRFVEKQRGLSEPVRNLVRNGAFWKSVAVAAVSEQDAEWLASGASGLLRTEVPIGAVDTPLRLDDQYMAAYQSDDPNQWAIGSYADLLFHAQQHASDLMLSSFVTQIVRSMCIVHKSITPSSLHGLHSFVEHFNRVTAMRKKRREMPRSDLVKYALRYLNQDGHLARLELRTTIGTGASPPSADDERELADLLYSHLREYRRQLDSGKVPELILPISFLRRSDDGEPHPIVSAERDRCRWAFFDVWSTMATLAAVYARCPSVLKFAGMIDVAGNEHELANWIFCHAIRELEARIAPEKRAWLRYTYHAGEYYATPLQGLRRIDEVITYLPQVKRLGHGIALALGKNQQQSELAHELIDDLAWAWQHVGPRLKRQIATTLDEIVSFYYGEKASPEEIKRAHALRFDRKFLKDHAVFEGDAFTEESSFTGEVLAACASDDDVSVRLFAKYMTHKNGDSLAQSIPLRSHEPLIRQIVDKVRPQMIARVIANDVVLELCPTSNMMVGGIDSYAEHPILSLRSWIKKGLKATINTDDPGLFHATISEEYASVWDASIRPGTSLRVRERWIDGIRQLGMSTCMVFGSGAALRADLDACLTELSDTYNLVEPVA